MINYRTLSNIRPEPDVRGGGLIHSRERHLLIIGMSICSSWAAPRNEIAQLGLGNDMRQNMNQNILSDELESVMIMN